jgi:hypothetical protein
MKITLEIPDNLLKWARATEAMRGESLEDFVTAALQAHLERQSTGASPRGWQSVFGHARQEEVEPVDATIAKEFWQVDLISMRAFRTRSFYRSDSQLTGRPLISTKSQQPAGIG